MDSLSYKTKFLNKDTAQKDWIVVDAKGKTLGRFASEVAKILKGKTKPGYTPHVDCGDNVIVLNASQAKLTGKKFTDKEYITHTGYTGGQRFQTPKSMIEKHPTRMVEWAIYGMLPKGRLGRQLFRNLYVYEGSEHPHAGQNPKVVNL